MPDPAVEMDGVWFGYDHDHVLRDVSLRIGRGEIAAVVGPNGGGKTTLVKLLLGLLEPDRGRIRVLGRSPHRARRKVGYMPQHCELDMRFPVSVTDVVLMGRLGRTAAVGPFRRADRRAVAEALGEVEMTEHRRVPFSRLSGGQRQRTLIARALASEPELLLLDEPTANLDVGVEGELYELLGRLAARMTIAIVSHDVGFVSRAVGKVICVRGEVNVHPTGELTGKVMRDLYGHDVRLVRHDHSFDVGPGPHDHGGEEGAHG